MGSGHYANVLALDERRGLALSTDGVGTKLMVAEALGRYDTVGIDCMAMNVNDVVCVGAEPIALLDYIAVVEADPAVLASVAEGLRRGAEDAGVEIPGGELAVVPEMVKGLDLVGACVGHGGPRRDRRRGRPSSRATRLSGCRPRACTPTG